MKNINNINIQIHNNHNPNPNSSNNNNDNNNNKEDSMQQQQQKENYLPKVKFNPIGLEDHHNDLGSSSNISKNFELYYTDSQGDFNFRRLMNQEIYFNNNPMIFNPALHSIHSNTSEMINEIVSYSQTTTTNTHLSQTYRRNSGDPSQERINLESKFSYLDSDINNVSDHPNYYYNNNNSNYDNNNNYDNVILI